MEIELVLYSCIFNHLGIELGTMGRLVIKVCAGVFIPKYMDVLELFA